MFIGQNKLTGEKVHIDDVVMSNTNEEYICPICKSDLIIKKGTINVSHFAHRALIACDTFTSDMSEWHKNWQNVFPKKNQEVVLEKEMTNIRYEENAMEHGFSDKTYEEYVNYKNNILLQNVTIRHRADVLACGYVIEFQHSPISRKEFNERNWFYNECGYKVIWIFDCIEEYQSKKIISIGEWNNQKENGGKYKWLYASKMFNDFVPQDHKPQYIDDIWWWGDVIVFFQMAEEEEGIGYIERIIWAIEDFGTSNFKRFMTSYYPGDKEELYEWIKNRKL